MREHELKPGGQHIQLTEQNKQEYIEYDNKKFQIQFDEICFIFSLVINYRFVQRMATQMNALKQGLQEILPLDSLRMFDEKEVEV